MSGERPKMLNLTAKLEIRNANFKKQRYTRKNIGRVGELCSNHIYVLNHYVTLENSFHHFGQTYLPTSHKEAEINYIWVLPPPQFLLYFIIIQKNVVCFFLPVPLFFYQ